MKTLFTMLTLLVSLASTTEASTDANLMLIARGDSTLDFSGSVMIPQGENMYYFFHRHEESDTLFQNPHVVVSATTGGGGMTLFTMSDTGLTPGALYHYWLKAINLTTGERDSAYLLVRTSAMPFIGQDLTGTTYDTNHVIMAVTLLETSWFTRVDFVDSATNTIVFTEDSIVGNGFQYIYAYFTQTPGTTKRYYAVASNISHSGVFDTSNVWSIEVDPLPIRPDVVSMQFSAITTDSVSVHPFWNSDNNGNATIWAFASCDSFATPFPTGTWFVTPGGAHDSLFTFPHTCGASANVWVMIVIQKAGEYDTLIQKYMSPAGPENILPRQDWVNLASATAQYSIHPINVGPLGATIQILYVSAANIGGPEQAEFTTLNPGDTIATFILQGQIDSCYEVRTHIYENDGTDRGTAYGDVDQLCFTITGLNDVMVTSDFPAYVQFTDLFGRTSSRILLSSLENIQDEFQREMPTSSGVIIVSMDPDRKTGVTKYKKFIKVN